MTNGGVYLMTVPVGAGGVPLPPYPYRHCLVPHPGMGGYPAGFPASCPVSYPPACYTVGYPTMMDPSVTMAGYRVPEAFTQLEDGLDRSPERLGGVLVPPPPAPPASLPLTVFTSAPPLHGLYSGASPPGGFPDSPPLTVYSGSPPPSVAPSGVPASASCLLTPPPTPEPTVWVRPRLGPAPVADPRTLAEVHCPGCVQPWTKGLQLEDGLVAVHVRHEAYTVEPAFPGPIERHHVTDPAGVMHVCVPIRLFRSQIDYGMYVVWVTCFAELFNQTGQHWALVPQPPSTPKPSHIWRSFSTSAKIRFRCERCQNAWTSMHGQVAFQYFLHKGPGAGTVFFQLFGQKCRVCVRQWQRERARSATATAPATATATATATAPAPAPAPASASAGAAAAEGGAAGGEAEGAVGGEGAVAAAPEEGAAAAAPAQPAARQEDDGVPYSNPMWYPDEVRRVLLELYSQVTAKLYPQLPRVAVPAGHQRRFGRPQQAHDPALCQGCAAGTCRMLKRR